VHVIWLPRYRVGMFDEAVITEAARRSTTWRHTAPL
jgi:hypothetical protein